MYPGVEHFNSNIKWKFDDSPCMEDDNISNLEHNLDRIRSLSQEKSFSGYGLKENDNLLEVEVNDIVEDDSDDGKDYNMSVHDNFDDKSEYGLAHKFSRNSSVSNRELDVIKESSRSSSDTEVTLTR
ncbi:uncharacterized protein LOC120630066 [Pararge aegeria]|uniref:Jg2552 protein n=1 Tax=Pararge aegeria aegeria TaxID=348720 RepID=A0A8S4R2U4_9NEOP|nr:uncharacterized protein LOC120630066 [Pararge aegeria]CAH2229108.1 jg2552 [Pararge aegeria aegeria]